MVFPEAIHNNNNNTNNNNNNPTLQSTTPPFGIKIPASVPASAWKVVAILSSVATMVMYTSMFAGGAVIGLTIGGFIIQDYGWHATFFTIIPIAIALLFIIWRFIHVDNGGVERTREQQQTEPTKSKNNSDSIKRKRTIAKSKSSISNTTIDVKGAITLAVTITSFLLLLTYLQTGSGANNNSTGSNSSSTIQIASFLVAGIISLALFIFVEKRINISTG